MKRIKPGISMLLAVLMLAGLLSGCGTAAGSGSGGGSAAASASASAETRDIVDMEGNTLTIPSDIKSIAITSWKGAFGACILLGQLDKVSVMADTSRYTWLQHAFPQLEDIPNYGSFNDVSTEQLLQASPDIVISPSSAADANKKMKELKMPVFVDGITPADADSVFDDEYAEIDAIAEMTGAKDTADAFYKWTNDLLAEIKSRVDAIPQAERKKVLVVRSSMEEVFCENITLGYSVILAGGDLVTKGINEYYTKVDPEQVVNWNPDFIFQQIVTTPYGDEMAKYYDNWRADSRYKNITAVKSGDCYIMPMGIEQWGGTIECPLGTLLMAKLMYPAQFADMDVKQYADEFYSKFLGYTMTDEDWAIMAPNFDNAKTTGLSK